MATAVVEERQLLKTLRWWDGFTIALCNPGFLLGSLGFTLGIFGVAGSIVLWGISAFIGVLQAFIYSEPATMFPSQTGGISIYAHEGWRRYTTFVGPIATFGGPWGGVKLSLVYLFILAWSAYGTEICATFAPEYQNTERDTAMALRSASIFALLVFTLLPLGLGGVSGSDLGDGAEGQFYVGAFKDIVGVSSLKWIFSPSCTIRLKANRITEPTSTPTPIQKSVQVP